MAHGHVAVMAKPFNPLNLAPTLWFDASDSTTITASSGKVSQWNDKSGNARHATQSTSSNQPTTGSTTQNGLNVLTFTASSTTYLTTTSGYNPSTVGVYAFFVTKATDLNAFKIVFAQQDSSGTGRVILSYQYTSASDPAVPYSGIGGPPFVFMTTATTSFALHRVTIDAGASKTLKVVRNAGSETATGTKAIESTVGTFRIGTGKGTPSSPFDGNIAEILVFPTLGAAAIDEVERYLNKKWAIY